MPRKKSVKKESEIASVPAVDQKPAESIESKNVAESEKILHSPEGELVVDVFETNSDFVVLAAIAGVKIQDLDIAVEKDMMVIKGQRTNPHTGEGKKYFYQECYWGPFSKKIVLPENVDTKSADAQIDKGILTVTIPKLSEDSKKEVQIS